jgi:hypothetical protein
MPKKSPDLTLEELPGDLYPSLAAAQEVALKATAYELAAVVRSLLESGVLVQVDGRIILAKGER